MRFSALGSALSLCVLAVVAAVTLGGWGFIVIAVMFGVIALIGIHDVVQRRHSILRNYPILGHMRFALESVRPPGQLIEEPPESWALDWERADPDSFAARTPQPSAA